MSESRCQAGVRRRPRAIDDLVVEHPVVSATDDELAWEDASGVEVGETARLVERLAGRERRAIGER